MRKLLPKNIWAGLFTNYWLGYRGHWGVFWKLYMPFCLAVNFPLGMVSSNKTAESIFEAIALIVWIASCWYFGNKAPQWDAQKSSDTSPSRGIVTTLISALVYVVLINLLGMPLNN